MARQPNKHLKSEETPLQKVTRMLDEGLDNLDGMLGDQEAEKAGNFAHTLVKVAQIAAELRKADKAERDANAAIGSKDVVEFIRRSTTADRKQLIRAIQDAEAEQGRSGLA